MQLEINSVRIDGGTQSRVNLSEQAIEQYRDLLQDNKQMPPISVMFDGVSYWLVDGFHRWHASRKAGLEMIEATVTNGTRRDAVLASLSVNDDHGLQRSQEDKRKAVLTMLTDYEWSKWSVNKIAESCKVHFRVVSKMISERQVERPATVLFERGGKVIEQKTKAKKESVQKTAKTEPSSPPVEDEEMSRMVVELSAENETLRQQVSVSSGGDEATATLAELQQDIKTLRAELSATRNSRDDLARENTELKKQVTYWRKKADDAAKAISA